MVIAPTSTTVGGDNPVGYLPFTSMSVWTAGGHLGTDRGQIPETVTPLCEAGDEHGIREWALTSPDVDPSTVHRPYYSFPQKLNLLKRGQQS